MNFLRLSIVLPRMLFYTSVVCYIVFALGSLVMLPVMWLQGPSLLQLFATLRDEHPPSKPMAIRRLLHSVFSFLFVFLDFIICVITQVLWSEVLSLQIENVVITTLATYSFFLMPSIHTFPIVLMVTSIHVLHDALADTNEALQQQFVPRPAGPSEPKVEHGHREQVYILRTLRARYLQLRHLHKLMTDIVATPLILWTLNRIFTMVMVTLCMVTYCEVELKRLAVTVESLLSLFLIGFVADGINVQVRKPLTAFVPFCLHGFR